MARRPEDVHVVAAEFHGEEDVDPLERHRAVHVEEVHGQHARGLGPQELPPRRIGGPERCRGYPPQFEDPADGRCSDAVSELERFTLVLLWPQVRFSPAIRSISAATASSMGGRPDWFG
jgi:hypothetical protein